MTDAGGELAADVPARRRLADELLAWGQPRPKAPPGLARSLLGTLEAGLAALRPALDEVAAGRRGGSLLVSKTGLDRLACDGWALEPEPYVHTRANARGVLAHAAIANDWLDRRALAAPAVVARTWQEEASRRPGDPSSLSAWMNGLAAAEADGLRAELADLVEANREVWPLLPADRVVVQVERPLVVRLADGLVTLRGVPDLVLSSPQVDERARSLVVDLKTGRPRTAHDRQELRFYALLVTLAAGRPPFRWSTFHVTEGRWEAEDLRVDVLEATVRRVLDGVAQQVRLAQVTAGALDAALVAVGAGEPPGGLTLQGGGWCWSCSRARACPLSQVDAMLDP